MFLQESEVAPPSPGGGSHGPDGPQLPIDGDIWILILMGAMLGVFVAYRRYRLKDKLA